MLKLHYMIIEVNIILFCLIRFIIYYNREMRF